MFIKTFFRNISVIGERLENILICITERKVVRQQKWDRAQNRIRFRWRLALENRFRFRFKRNSKFGCRIIGFKLISFQEQFKSAKETSIEISQFCRLVLKPSQNKLHHFWFLFSQLPAVKKGIKNCAARNCFVTALKCFFL